MRNQAEEAAGRRRYYDVRYLEFATVVELDGREAHPPDESFRDLRRDNAIRTTGDLVLRFGWRDVAGRPCQVAGMVAAHLMACGWTGRPRPCAPHCQLPLDQLAPDWGRPRP